MPDGDRIGLVRDRMLCEDLMEEVHRCDEKCVCPYHSLPMYYAPGGKEHACQNIDCVYARGYEKRLALEFADYYGLRYGC